MSRQKAIRVYVSFPVLPEVRTLIKRRCDAEFNDSGSVLSTTELMRAARGHGALMITVTDRLTSRTLDLLPDEVRVLATYSVGHDHIDLDAAARRNLVVLNTPDVLTDAVAEIAVFLMIGAARRATESIALLRKGQWTGWSPVQLPGLQLSGRRLGILGMGRIGQAVATRARVLGMTIHYTRSRPLESVLEGEALYHGDIDDLLQHSDVLLLACPVTSQTHRFLNAERINSLPEGAIVVNIARGDVIDDDALINALISGRVRAAGLDVFTNEPHLDRRYLLLPNVIMTPHIGSSTIEARISMASVLLDGLDAMERGESPSNRIT